MSMAWLSGEVVTSGSNFSFESGFCSRMPALWKLSSEICEVTTSDCDMLLLRTDIQVRNGAGITRFSSPAFTIRA